MGSREATGSGGGGSRCGRAWLLERARQEGLAGERRAVLSGQVRVLWALACSGEGRALLVRR